LKNPLRRLFTFPFFRWARYVALTVIAGALLLFVFTCEEWRVRRNPLLFAVPLGFVCNSLSVEILFYRLRKGAKPPE
jgi:hypothetical protein